MWNITQSLRLIGPRMEAWQAISLISDWQYSTNYDFWLKNPLFSQLTLHWCRATMAWDNTVYNKSIRKSISFFLVRWSNALPYASPVVQIWEILFARTQNAQFPMWTQRHSMKRKATDATQLVWQSLKCLVSAFRVIDRRCKNCVVIFEGFGLMCWWNVFVVSFRDTMHSITIQWHKANIPNKLTFKHRGQIFPITRSPQNQTTTQQ